MRAKYAGKDIRILRQPMLSERVEVWVLKRTSSWYLLSEENLDTLHSLAGSSGSVALNFNRKGESYQFPVPLLA